MVTRQRYVTAARFLAHILDRSVRLPGTSIRIGLDPLIGLIPGVGDAVAGLAGSLIVVLAAQLRVPRIVLVRMSANIALNGLIGALDVCRGITGGAHRPLCRSRPGGGVACDDGVAPIGLT